MKQELENKLFESYPKIFVQKDLPMQKTCMCWGISCGDGWYYLLDRLCTKIQNYVNSSHVGQIEAVQVKEKFSGLRFYTNYSDNVVDKFIEEAELESYNTCEICGTIENVGVTKGWPISCCENCAKKIGREWKINE